MKRLILAVGLLVVCGGCSPPPIDTETPVDVEGTPEDRAVAFVWNLGGKVIRDEKRPGKPVVEVYLSKTEVTDAGLRELLALTSLIKLELWGTGVTGAGVKELAALPNLAALDLGHTKVTDAGMKELAALKHVTALRLDGTQVTDAGVKELAALNLGRLNLTGTQVTDAGLKEFQMALPKCKITK